ncbi:hypothetical protein MTDSW087_01332 [Methylobacterium dankookense]|uniref:Uncharacterized protein n=1 Tax=Methylobacterium dankookense TaxID=560405 RepID=A0A564FV28_9HYPH|nr:hypothetical protein IFDJLNFL_3403 [Methylobacterium dankookense]VUF11648.1 hypothetical protein MTDSW087_01332 [Methylobacterium dankookense]
MNQERRRLSATWLNTIASGVVSAGTCGSLLAYSFGTRPGVTGLQVLAIVAASILTGLLLHLAARGILGQEERDR